MCCVVPPQFFELGNNTAKSKIVEMEPLVCVFSIQAMNKQKKKFEWIHHKIYRNKKIQMQQN